MLVDYIFLLVSLLFYFIISIALFFASNYIVFKTYNNDKNSPYECGFNPYSNYKNSFEIKFYMVAILFVIFDIEIALMVPWLFSIKISGLLGGGVFLFFLVMLTLGFIYEWYKGALDW